MRKRVNKIVFVLLLCFCMCGITITAFAATEYVDGYLRYTVADGSVTITGYNGRESEVTVPSKIAGVPVNTIASGAFSNATTVTKVNLPDTIMTIEEGAFTIGQTVVYNSNTDDTVVTEPEQPTTPPVQQPTEPPVQEPTTTPTPEPTQEPTEAPDTPVQNTEEPVTQSSTGNFDNPSDTVQPSVTDKVEDTVTETEKIGSVEEVDVDFDDGLENATTEKSVEASESEENRNEQDMTEADEVAVTDDTDVKKSDNKVLLIVAGIVVLAVAVAGICIYRKKGRR